MAKPLLSEGKLATFDALVSEVRACRMCPRMADSDRVLGHACGALAAEVMFIGEAPGRLGADATQVPFHGDAAGRNFEFLLDDVGLSRYDAFITNAVLCNPKDSAGNNSTPTQAEIDNCSPFLRRQIELVDPTIVVTLGSVALKATSGLEPHGLTLAPSVRTKKKWCGRFLIPLYHPGQRAMIHRSLANQRSDYRFVADTVARLGRTAAASKAKIGDRTTAVVRRIIEKSSRVTYFSLHKLFYLVEVEAIEKLGNRLTNSFVIRQKDGPYCVDLHIARLRRALPDIAVASHGSKLSVSLPTQLDLQDSATVGRSPEVLAVREVQLIDEIVEKYRGYSDSKLKTRVYLTREMRAILRRETQSTIGLYNIPLLGSPKP